MKVVLDIQYLDDKGHGNLNFQLARYAYGVFLTQDPAGNTFIAVKNGDKVEKIRLEDANKDLIVGLYDEAKERESREKKMEEFKDLLLRVCERTKKIEESLISGGKKFAEALDRIVERYIRETYLGVAEMKKQKDEAKEKEPLSEDCFKGFISEAALEESFVKSYRKRRLEMEKGKSDMTIDEVIEAGNRLHEIAFQSVIRNGALNTGNLASVIAIAWRLSFAYAERGTGLEAARQAFSPALNIMMDALIDGAWDEENQKVK